MTEKNKEHNTEDGSRPLSSVITSQSGPVKGFPDKKNEDNSGGKNQNKACNFLKPEIIAAISTAIIAIWTIVYSVIAGLQWLEIRRESEISQRAYLSAKSPETIGGGFGLLRIQIENYGKIPSKWLKLHMNYLLIKTDLKTGNLTYLDNRTINVQENKPIYPGQNNHQITIMIPRKGSAPKKLSRNESILIRARITYDTGFGDTDTLTICENFSGGKPEWESCGGLSTSIDLDEAKATQSQ